MHLFLRGRIQDMKYIKRNIVPVAVLALAVLQESACLI